MKLIYTGSQGTGKSTILNETKGLERITEVVRNLSKTGVKINRDGDEDGQKIIFNTYKKLLSEKDNYVSDRGLTDVVAYSLYLYMHNPEVMSKELVIEQVFELREFNKNHPDVLYVYFPIEFPVVGDGVRDTDEEYRLEIDMAIKNLLRTSGCKFVTIHGTVEERVKFIENLIKNNSD